MALSVQVVSPERILFEGEARTVIARTAGGDIAFMTGHAPFVGTLGIGKVVILAEDRSEADVVLAVHGGFVEVSNNKVTVLSDVAELADAIDVERARDALSRAGDDEGARRRAEVRIEVAAEAR